MHAPDFPLSREVFAAAVTTGHGRVRQHVERFGVKGHEEAIRNAVFQCWTYDTQLEGFREEWLAMLCQEVGFEQAVFDWRPEEEELIRQRSAVLACFHGFDPGVLWEAIKPYARRAKQHSGLLCMASSLKVAPEDALLHYARLEGEERQKDHQAFIDDRVLCEYQCIVGERDSAWALLREAAKEDDSIRLYVEELERQAKKPKRVEPSRQVPLTFEKVRAFILNGPGPPTRFRFWSWHSEPSQVMQLQGSLPEDLNDMQLERWLAVCERKGFPILEERFFAYLEHPSKEVRERANTCFSHHEHTELRRRGLAFLEQEQWLMAVELLKKNAQLEDVDLLIRALPSLSVEEGLHWLCCQLEKAMKCNPSFHDQRVALYCYELNPCSHCREVVVGLLQEWKTLPDWIAEECRFDVAEGVRKLVAPGGAP